MNATTWNPHPNVGLRAPKSYPKGSAQFNPTWYLIHNTEDAFIGPFADADEAAAYKEAHEIQTYSVVRMKSPQKKVTAPVDYKEA